VNAPRAYVPIPQAAASLYFTFSLLPAPADVEGGIKGREKELFFQEIDALLARSKTLMPKNRRGPS